MTEVERMDNSPHKRVAMWGGVQQQKTPANRALNTQEGGKHIEGH